MITETHNNINVLGFGVCYDDTRNKKLSQLDRTQMSKKQSRESCDTVVALGDVLLVMGNRTGLELPWLQ